MREVEMPDVEICPEIVCGAPFSRFHELPDEKDFCTEHVVRPSDVDMGQHMNNTAYIRAMLDTFTVKEWKALEPEEMEICFRQPCYGGETLAIRRRELGDGWLFLVQRPDGRQSALAKLKRR